MGNPYYVQPAGDISGGLQGLSTSVDKYGELKRFNEINQGAAKVYQTDNFDAIAEYSLAHPEVAQNLVKLSDLRDDKNKEFYADTIFQVLQDPENIEKIVLTRQAIAKAQGIGPGDTSKVAHFMDKYNEDPKGTLAKLEKELAFVAPEKYKAYRTALGLTDKKTAAMNNFDYFKKLEKEDPVLAEQFGTGTGFIKPDESKKPTAAMKNFSSYINLLTKDPEQAKMFGDSIGINRTTPHTDMAKLRTDLNNGLITQEDYDKKRNDILNPLLKSKTELTMAALRGDPEAKNTLEEMNKDAITTAKDRSKATTEGKLEGLYSAMDLDAAADAILAGSETLDGVKNTFGVPIQEVVRKKVLEKEPDFNFVQPRAIQKSLTSSLQQQQKNRGAMGSFVGNINGQLEKVDKIMNDVISRVGVRALDVPLRELNTRFMGSGHERVLEAYMKEISVEIFKLSQGSQASVALLPEAGRKEWEKIHDFNLPYRELKKVLLGTRDMANIRLKYTNKEIEQTIKNLENVRGLKNPYSAKEGETGSEFDTSKTITVTNPNTGEEETWDLKTEKRIK